MFGAKIKIDKDLLERAREYSQKKGYPSVEEFVSHIIEKEMKNPDTSSSEDEIKKRLKGLGYIS
jgi:metal-responsive CopG/Arc/MetJ family transcriptional regulator